MDHNVINLIKIQKEIQLKVSESNNRIKMPEIVAVSKTFKIIDIEPMINLGGREIYTSKDGWTILTTDGKASAHFEHTIAILDDGPKILSMVSKNG